MHPPVRVSGRPDHATYRSPRSSLRRVVNRSRLLAHIRGPFDRDKQDQGTDEDRNCDEEPTTTIFGWNGVITHVRRNGRDAG